MENIMQKQEMKEAIKIAGMSKQIPSTKNMVPVESLLSKTDLERVADYNMGSVAVKAGDGVFFLSLKHNVPDNSVVMRDQEQQVLGIPAVVGG